MKHWLDSIMQQAESNIVIMLVGCKLDLVNKDEKRREVSKDEPLKLIEQFSNINMKCMETSAVEKINVSDAFETLL